VGLKGDFALLSSQVSQSLGNVSSSIAALQGDSRAQMQILRNVEAAQHQMQAHSTAFERLAASIDRSTAENLQWRKDHEAETGRWRAEHEKTNQQVADRVTKFQGILVGVSLLAASAFSVGIMWISAEFANIRREHTADVQQIRQTVAENRVQERSSP
jgi:hypothetical protein